MLYVGSWYFLVMKEFLKKLIVGVLLIICIGLNFEKSNIIADEWSEPVKFYNSYGNSAVFKPTNIYEGDIYFCSAGNTSTSGTKYRTIGYKMSVKNSSGNVIQTIYYQMGGSYMTLKCQTTIQVKILSRSFYAEILALQGFPAGLRDSYFIRDKSGKEIRRRAAGSPAWCWGRLFGHLQ